MKTSKLIVIFGVLAIAALAAARPAEEEYEYEDEPAPPPKKVPARGPLVGRRNPLAKNNKPAPSTTTTAVPVEEEAPAEGDYDEEPQQVETSSTTEAPKKFIKSGIVRPFRSNDDLLATLKRRREQVVTNKQSRPAVASSEPKEEVVAEPVQKESKPAASSGRRNRFNKTKASNDVPVAEEPSAATPTRTGRGRFSARS